MVYWLKRHLLTDLAKLLSLHQDREVNSTVMSISTNKDAAQMLKSEDDTHTYPHLNTTAAERNSLPSSHNTSHHTRSSGTNKHTRPKCSRRDPPANCTDSLATVHGLHAFKCTHTSAHSLHGTCTCHNRLPSDTHALRFLPPGLQRVHSAPSQLPLLNERHHS